MPAERERRAAGKRDRTGQAQEKKKLQKAFGQKHFSVELDRKTKHPKFVRVCSFIHPAS